MPDQGMLTEAEDEKNPYHRNHFVYNEEKNTFTSPEQQELIYSRRSWSEKNNQKADRYICNTSYKYYLVQFKPAKIYANPQVLFTLSAPNEFVASVINSLTSSKVLKNLLVNFLLSIAHIFSAGFSSGL